jgi:hypothetical protein
VPLRHKKDEERCFVNIREYAVPQSFKLNVGSQA